MSERNERNPGERNPKERKPAKRATETGTEHNAITRQVEWPRPRANTIQASPEKLVEKHARPALRFNDLFDGEW